LETDRLFGASTTTEHAALQAHSRDALGRTRTVDPARQSPNRARRSSGPWQPEDSDARRQGYPL